MVQKVYLPGQIFLLPFKKMPVKCSVTHAKCCCGCAYCHFAISTPITYVLEPIWQRVSFSPQVLALGSRGRDSLRLALMYGFTLGLSEIRHDLQYHVRDERSRQVPVLCPGIKQIHVEYKDIGADVFRDVLSLCKNLIVISAQSIYAL